VKRFDRLEFDAPQERPQPGAGGRLQEELHDEQHWLKQADAERREGYFENALRYYSRALELNKSLATGWLGQVQMLVQLGELKEAELWSRKALELFRKNGELTAGRAQALARMMQLNEAMPLLDAAFAQEGQSAYRWMVRGEVMLATGESVDQHCFSKAVQLDGDWLVAVEIGQIYLYYRRSAKAIMYFRKAVERAPGEAYCWYVQGCCEQELGLSGPAKASFLRCLDLKPNHSDARRRLISLEADGWSIGKRLRRLFRRR
jgi:tetratricopeptide (TPR) repeat protein